MWRSGEPTPPVNDGWEYPFIVDTGASHTTIPRKFALEMGYNPQRGERVGVAVEDERALALGDAKVIAHEVVHPAHGRVVQTHGRSVPHSDAARWGLRVAGTSSDDAP